MRDPARRPEPGAGRATALGQAARRAHPRDRILSAGAPEPDDVATWLGLWTPELGKSHTAVIVRDVDLLPVWAAERLRDLITRGAGAAGAGVPFAITAERFADIPAALARLVDTVVEVAPLRERSGDILPLAAHIARQARGRDVGVASAPNMGRGPMPCSATLTPRSVRTAACASIGLPVPGDTGRARRG